MARGMVSAMGVVDVIAPAGGCTVCQNNFLCITTDLQTYALTLIKTFRTITILLTFMGGGPGSYWPIGDGRVAEGSMAIPVAVLGVAYPYP